MHTDTFSFEIENEGVVSVIKILQPISESNNRMILCITFSGVHFEMPMLYNSVNNNFTFDRTGGWVPLVIQALEQKISDKIISRNL